MRMTGGATRSEVKELKLDNQRLDELEPQDFESYSYRPRHELYFWPLGAFLLLTTGYHLSMLVMGLVSRRRGPALPVRASAETGKAG